MSHNPELRAVDGTGTPTRVRIIAQDRLVAEAFSGALSELPSLTIVDAGANADVVLWDGGPDKTHVRRSELRAAAGAELPVLALAHDDAHAAALLAAGARGAVLRQASAPRLAAALVAVRHGLCVLDAELAGTQFVPLPAALESETEANLTAREREVLGQLALGLSNKLIARRLDVSIHTVKFHVNSILAKLGADSRTGAVSTAVRRGLLAL
jgi:two-component system nitrate/nitrite response regulator NarL